MMSKSKQPDAPAKEASFAQQLHAANPAGARLLDKNSAKADMAHAMRAMRKTRKITQDQIREISGLTQPMISRLESPLGPMPTLESVVRYVQACGGQVSMDFRINDATSNPQTDRAHHVVALF